MTANGDQGEPGGVGTCSHIGSGVGDLIGSGIHGGSDGGGPGGCTGAIIVMLVRSYQQ